MSSYIALYHIYISYILMFTESTLQYTRDGVSNRQLHHCLLDRLFRRRSKKTSKHRVTGLCAGKSPVNGEFPAQIASNAEDVSIWWRHRGLMSVIDSYICSTQ